MGNKTIDVLNSVFKLGSFDLPTESIYVAVIIGILIYTFTIFCNLLLIVIIATNRNLHDPMYVFLFNLSINDMIGISAVIPRIVYDWMFEHRLISFPACLIQAWCIHMYGGATLLILSVMAFDRYIAICHPLRYHTIMSKITVINLIFFVWFIDFLLVGALFGLMLRFPFCKTVLVNFYCDNMSLLRLTCATNITVNNVYGLFITGILHGIGVLSVVFSYGWILFTCFRSNDSDSKSKALHTCATHLLVFLIYELSGIIIVLVYRLPNSPRILQQFMGLTFVIFPPSLNPIIYGVKTKEIKVKIKQIIHNRILTLRVSGDSKTETVKTIAS